ncbi:MAG TPA: phytanoyl-CoA dioxygenase family protein [Stellaceae bacterium]|nr:phytanoyl-CoA dioxygenase family protein [Stellaceae bacterium]
MPKCLTPAQIEQYREEGCVFPIRIMSEGEAAELRSRLEAFERRTGGPLKGDLRHKSHLLFTWLAELVRCSSILDAVEDLHGPDLLCWTTNFFIKEAADPAFVSWHQDSTYWGLSTQDVVTAWVAFTPATEANGAMEYIPRSHKLDQIPHRDTFAKHNLLTRGQEVMVEVDRSRRRIITLRPGEMSLHHVRLVHGSPPNPSNDRRIGFAIRYIPTMVAQLAGEDSASLVRGEDRHHHFALEPQPTRDLDAEFVAFHRTITERNARILYRGTDVASYNEPKALAQRG